MSESNEQKRNFLICEAIKRRDGRHSQLKLLPLCNTEQYGTIFLGTECIRNGTISSLDSVWRISNNGKIEKAKITKNLEYLSFQGTDYYFFNKIERASVSEVFKSNTSSYKELLDRYGDSIRRVQRYYSSHPQLNRVKEYAASHKKEIASLVVALELAARRDTSSRRYSRKWREYR